MQDNMLQFTKEWEAMQVWREQTTATTTRPHVLLHTVDKTLHVGKHTDHQHSAALQSVFNGAESDDGCLQNNVGEGQSFIVPYRFT